MESKENIFIDISQNMLANSICILELKRSILSLSNTIYKSFQ